MPKYKVDKDTLNFANEGEYVQYLQDVEGLPEEDAKKYASQSLVVDKPKPPTYDFNAIHSRPISDPVRRMFELGYDNLNEDEKARVSDDYYKKLASDPEIVRSQFGNTFESFLDKTNQLGSQYREEFQPNPIARSVQTFGRGFLTLKNKLDEAAQFSLNKGIGGNAIAGLLNHPLSAIARDILRQVTLDPSVLTTETGPKDIATEFGIKASEILPLLLTGGEAGAAKGVISGIRAMGGPVGRVAASAGFGGIHSLLKDLQSEANTGEEVGKLKSAAELAGGMATGGLLQGAPEYLESKLKEPNQQVFKFPGFWKLLSRDANKQVARGALSPEFATEYLKRVAAAVPTGIEGATYPSTRYQPTAMGVIQDMIKEMNEKTYIPAQARALELAKASPESPYPAFMDPNKPIGLGNDILSRTYNELIKKGYSIPSAEASVTNDIFPMFASIPYGKAQKMLKNPAPIPDAVKKANEIIHNEFGTVGELNKKNREMWDEVRKVKIPEKEGRRLSERDIASLKLAEEVKPLNELLAKIGQAFNESPRGSDAYREVTQSGSLIPNFYPRIKNALRQEIALRRTDPSLSATEQLAKTADKVIGDAYRAPVGFDTEIPALGSGEWKEGKWYPDFQVKSLITPEADLRFAQAKSIEQMNKETPDSPGRMRSNRDPWYSWFYSPFRGKGRQSHTYSADFENPSYKNAIDAFTKEEKIRSTLDQVLKSPADKLIRYRTYSVQDWIQDQYEPNNVADRMTGRDVKTDFNQGIQETMAKLAEAAKLKAYSDSVLEAGKSK